MGDMAAELRTRKDQALRLIDNLINAHSLSSPLRHEDNELSNLVDHVLMGTKTDSETDVQMEDE